LPSARRLITDTPVGVEPEAILPRSRAKLVLNTLSLLNAMEALPLHPSHQCYPEAEGARPRPTPALAPPCPDYAGQNWGRGNKQPPHHSCHQRSPYSSPTTNPRE